MDLIHPDSTVEPLPEEYKLFQFNSIVGLISDPPTHRFSLCLDIWDDLTDETFRANDGQHPIEGLRYVLIRPKPQPIVEVPADLLDALLMPWREAHDNESETWIAAERALLAARKES